ncbi:DUF6350 family protein [Brachybacterium huguangmaarense]
MRHARAGLDVAPRGDQHGRALPLGTYPSTRNGRPRVTDTPDDRIASPLAMGAVAGLVAVAVALAVAVVPALAAQLGSDQGGLGVLGAVLLGVDAFVLGHGGSLLLSDGPVMGAVHLAPLGLTAVYVLSAALGMRRMSRRLDLVAASGALRIGALRDAGAAVAAFVVVYAACSAVLASIGVTPRVHPVLSTVVLASVVVSLVGALAGVLWSLRRDASPGVPAVRLLPLLPSPLDAAARGIAVALLGLGAVAMLAVVVALGLGFRGAAGLWDSVDPGLVGGAVLLLIQLALMPTIALWALAALLGGTFTLGAGTAVSLGASDPGVLPALPLLGAMPGPGTAPGWTWFLLFAPIAALGAGAAAVVRAARGRELRSRTGAWGAYALGVLVLVLLALELSTGSIGDERLAHLGPELGTVVLPLAGMVLGTLGLAILVLDSPLVGRVRGGVDAVRRRVEEAEREEQGTPKD